MTNLNKGALGEKNIPALVTLSIVAKPSIGRERVSDEKYKQEKIHVDLCVKNAIIMSKPKFTEWLVEKGLVRNNQSCQVHIDQQKFHIPYKLALYPNIQKFPHSGGYVWVSECCPRKWISVYHKSIFEAESYTPITILKLIYHWLFQSQIVQVVQWVNVQADYIEYFYGLMRAVCVSIGAEKFQRLGGKNERIEVAVISVPMRDLDKINILGVMEPSTYSIKMKALDPAVMGNEKKFGTQVLKEMLDWVHLDSTVCIDSSINKVALIGLGFVNVVEGPSYQDQNLRLSGTYHNHNIADYLTTNVKPMLQGKVLDVQLALIQQFLEELSWREMYGRSPQALFSNFIQHLAEMTHLNLNESLKKKLERILQDPTRNVRFASLDLVGNLKPKESIPFKESTRATPLYREMVPEPPPASSSPQVIDL